MITNTLIATDLFIQLDGEAVNIKDVFKTKAMSELPIFLPKLTATFGDGPVHCVNLNLSYTNIFNLFDVKDKYVNSKQTNDLGGTIIAEDVVIYTNGRWISITDLFEKSYLRSIRKSML